MTSPTAAGVVIVTGGGRGIGAATCQQLSTSGWKVAVVDRDDGAAETVARRLGELGGQALALGADVAEPGDWERLVEDVRQSLGPVSGLVSNAAHLTRTPFDELSLDSFSRTVSVNLTGAVLGIRACLADLRRQRGSVVLVSSVHAGFGLPLHTAYASTKAALEGLTRQLAAELGPAIRINAVRPGPILTAAWDDISEVDRARSAASTVLDRLGTPEEVASPIAFLLGTGSSYITGSVVTVDGGWSIAKESA